jgi:outer membrane protein
MKAGASYIIASIVTSLGIAVNAWGASGTAASSDPSSSVINGLKAPVSSKMSWQMPDMEAFSRMLKDQEPAEIDEQKEYDLTELIDIAERANPETKTAWEQARQAASIVGLAQSEYYPILALKASGDWAKQPVPLPAAAGQTGFFDIEAQVIQPVAVLEWTLLDFGRRKASVGAAKEQLLAANLGFNARHQEIVFKVQSAFYDLCKAHGRILVAQSALDSALKVQAAAKERFQWGMATAPDVSQAQQQAAQAAFDLEEVQVGERDALVTLDESIGILPTTPIRVVDFSTLSLPTNLEATVETFIDRTYKQRPDLLAKVAVLRQKEEGVHQARADYYPTLSFRGEAGGISGRAQATVGGTAFSWASATEPTWNVGVALNWPLFEGGARKRKLEIAKSEQAAAQHTVEDAKNQAISQVWRFYSDTRLAIHRLDVASSLVEASEKSYQQTFEAYQNGLSSLVELLQARSELSRARYAQIDTRATLLKSAAALAFASGDLGTQLHARKSENMSQKP